MISTDGSAPIPGISIPIWIVKAGVDVRRETISFGATVAATKFLDATLDLGTTRVEQSGNIAREVDEGPFLSFDVIRAMTNGTLEGALKSDLDENGRRTTLEFTRAMDLPRGSLRFGGGISRNDTTDSDLRPLYGFALTYDLPHGSLSGSFDQSFGSDSAGNETLRSRLQIQLEQDLTAQDSFLVYVRMNDSDRAGAVDSRVVQLGLDYTRDLTQDWALVSGYRHSRSTDSSGGEEIDETFFVGLRTSLSWRP